MSVVLETVSTFQVLISATAPEEWLQLQIARDALMLMSVQLTDGCVNRASVRTQMERTNVNVELVSQSRMEKPAALMMMNVVVIRTNVIPAPTVPTRKAPTNVPVTMDLPETDSTVQMKTSVCTTMEVVVTMQDA
jgi:hypothetical protein